MAGDLKLKEIISLFLWFLLVCIAITFVFSFLSWTGRTLADDFRVKACIKWVSLGTLLFWVFVGNYIAVVITIGSLTENEGPFGSTPEISVSGATIYSESDSFFYDLYVRFLEIFFGGDVLPSVDQETSEVSGDIGLLPEGELANSSTASEVMLPDLGEFRSNDANINELSYNECIDLAKESRDTEDLIRCLNLKN